MSEYYLEDIMSILKQAQVQADEIIIAAIADRQELDNNLSQAVEIASQLKSVIERLKALGRGHFTDVSWNVLNERG